MTVAQLIMATLACWQTVEVWRHSAIAASWRARVQARNDFLSDVLGCPFCASVWVGWGVATLILLPEFLENPRTGLGVFGLLVRIFVAGVGVSRLANLGNDVFHSVTRTPKESIDQNQF